jgi:exodeoxyribonuclease VII large subunit
MSDQKVWSVYEVNSAMRELVENSLMPFWLKGEVGTLNIHRSGHVYMTLKDNRSQLRAVFFSGATRAREMSLQVGTEVEVFGKLTVYEVRGEYQISVRQIRPVGQGDLQRRFEELKQKLDAEGLFAPERKKPIPMLPEKIGIVTSADGAAVRDFLQVVYRRFPNIHIMIYPAQVQGKGAEVTVSEGIKFFNRTGKVDVIVVTRGGGSMEDLWPFNEEILARTVAASNIPIISAVGHEIDFTICDFAADLRVPTPSAAAELVIGRREELEQQLKRAEKDMRSAITMLLQELRSRVKTASSSYVFREPLHVLRQKQQYLDEMSRNLNLFLVQSIRNKQSQQQALSSRLKSLAPLPLLRQNRMRLDNLTRAMTREADNFKDRLSAGIASLTDRMNTMSPDNVLKRGYSILRDPATGELITTPDQPAGKKIRAELANGHIDSIIKESVSYSK